MRVVCDSSTLIALAKIKRVDLLRRLFTKVFIPDEVYREVVIKGKNKAGAREIKLATCVWVKKVKVKDELATEILSPKLRRGEAEAIVLSRELKVDWLLIDEDEGRRIARNLNIKTKGSIGILITAYKSGLIKEIKENINELRNKGIWISKEVYDMALKEIKEGV